MVPQVRAETITVNLLELQLALDNAQFRGDSISRDLLNRVSDAIAESDLGFDGGELLYQDNDVNITVEGGCNRTVILQMNTDILLQSDTPYTTQLF